MNKNNGFVLTKSFDLIVIKPDFCNFADSISFLFELVKSLHYDILWGDIGFNAKVFPLIS